MDWANNAFLRPYLFFHCFKQKSWPFTFSYSRNLPSSADIQHYLEWAGTTDVLNYHNEYHYQLDEDGYITESQYIGNDNNGIVVTSRYEYVR